MAMNIQRGKVGYKGVDNYSCFFGAVGDKVYYFIDPNGLKLYYETDNIEVSNFKLSNGNIVVTSLLNEAVDPQIKAVNVGLVNENGDVVVPLENRKIVKLKDDLLLVEKAVPSSQSVLDAVEMRNDPSAATQLVSTTATIKDQITAAMGGEVGQYLFNDMLSEASILDYDGNNLLNGEYYSFICMSGDGTKIALSKNVVSTIMMFDTTTKTFAPVAVENELDVTTTGADGAVVEDAMASADGVVDMPEVAAPVGEAEEGDMFDIAAPKEDNTMTLPSADELNAFTVAEDGEELVKTDDVVDINAGVAPVVEAPVDGVEPVAADVPIEDGGAPTGEEVHQDEEVMPITDEIVPVGEDIVPIGEEGLTNEGEPVATNAPVEAGEVPVDPPVAADEVVDPEAIVPIAEELLNDGLVPTEGAVPEDVPAVDDGLASDNTPVETPAVDEPAPENIPAGDEPDPGSIEPPVEDAPAVDDGLPSEDVPTDGSLGDVPAEKPTDDIAHTSVDGEFSIPMVEADDADKTLGENSQPDGMAESVTDEVVPEGLPVGEAPTDDAIATEPPLEEKGEEILAIGTEPPVEEFSENLFEVNPEDNPVQDEGLDTDSPVTELEQAMSGPVAIDPSEVALKVDRDRNGILDREEDVPQMDLFKEQPAATSDLDLGDIPLGTRDVNNNQYIDSAAELMMPANRDLADPMTYSYGDIYPQYQTDNESEFMRNVAETLRSLINKDKQNRRIIAEDGRTISDLRGRLASSQRENEELRYVNDGLRNQIGDLRRQVQGSDEIRRLLNESQAVLQQDSTSYYRRAA